jgi:RHS repeat-associated protein
VFSWYTDGAPTEIHHSGGYRVRVETADGRVTALRLAGDPDVDVVQFEYTDGHLTGVVNSSGIPLRFSYDHAGRLTEWGDRSGTWYRYRYDADGRCVQQTGPDGVMGHTFTYADDRVEATDSLGHTRVFVHNEAKQIIREVDQLGNETRSKFDRYDRLLARIDPLGQVTRYTYDEHGNLVTVTRPDGTQSLAEYNDLGMPTVVVQPDGGAWRREYDDIGNLLSVTDPAGAMTRYSYDEHGHRTTVTDALGHTTRIDNDAAGLPVAVTNLAGAVTQYRRDQFGRLTAVIDPLGGVTTQEWTVEGRLAARAAPDGAIERWSYDGEGNLVEHIDASGHITRTEYTHFDLPAVQVAPDGARLEYTYDTDLKLTRVTNPQGLSWEYFYDQAGRLIAESDFNDRMLSYDYNAAGQLVRRVNGAAQVIEYTRDILGRITQERTGDTVTVFEHDELGRLLRATGPDVELVYERDPLGRVLAETLNGRTVASGYDTVGHRTHRTTPGGMRSDWDYDPLGNLSGLNLNGHAVRFDRDAAGREVRRHLGETALLEQTWDRNHRLTAQALTAIGSAQSDFDPAGQLEDPTDATQRELLQSRAYSYAINGSLVGVDDLLGGSRKFTLDPAGRITAVHGPRWTEFYTYDQAGNVADAAWPPAPATRDVMGPREYHGTLITRAGATRYRHDAQGRVTQRIKTRLSRKPDIWHYTWDAHDRLIGVTTPDGTRWRYLYDPLGRRTAKQRLTHDSTVTQQIDFTWDGTNLIEQASWDRSTAALHVATWEYDGVEPLAQIERRIDHNTPQPIVDERFYAIVTDLVGSPTELVDEAGTVAGHVRTTLWGNATWTPAGAYTPLRFPGQYFDPETGLNYNYLRHYDPETARYTSLDPLGLTPSPNPNTYVHNPTGLIDPLGLAPCAPAKPAWITPGSLPVSEDAALDATLRHIDDGTVPTDPTGVKWGSKFKNWAGDLPGGQGPVDSPYLEYRVAPPPGTGGAGPLRVVVNSQTGEMYYTWTHYGDSGNPAFVRIR